VSVGEQIRHCRVCDAAALRDPGIRSLTREAFGRPLQTSRWRVGARLDAAEARRRWGLAMSLRAFGVLGVAGERTELLVVGDRSDEAIYWLTRRVRRVFAGHLDLDDTAWRTDGAGGPMLIDAARQTELPWNPRRLVLQPMGLGELRYEDGSIDALLCAGALEGAGGLAEARRLALEMHRVLKPGGAAAITTTFRLQGPPGSAGDAVLFDEAELRDVLLGQELYWAFSDPLAAADLEADLASRDAEHVWTSVHLLLVKPLYR
jgi:SAM-dependent methyltransferase